jgi:acetyl esterase/lipase
VPSPWIVGILTVCALLVGCSSAGSGATDATTTPVAPTPVTVADRPSAVGPTAYVDAAVPPVEVAYGPDPLQKMDVYTTTVPVLGTILYIHGGAWTGGSKEENTSAVALSATPEVRADALAQAAGSDSPGRRLVISELTKGWDVVSINYRLATEAPGPGIRAPQLLADVDRAVRYTRQNAAALGLDMTTFVIAGGSAGGHLALMHAQGAPTNAFMDPNLPPDLAAVPATVDAVAGLVAPTDLHTMWMAGGIAPGGQEALLGCTLAEVPTIPGMGGPCDPAVVDRYSPLVWSQTYVAQGETLPPAYFAYGGEDTLVQMDPQGWPNIDAWTLAAGANQTWVDYPATGTHNIDDQMNYLAFDAWLDHVASGNWDRPG